MSYTSLIFRRAVKLGIIPANPMDLVDIPKKHVDVLDNNKHNYWSLQQLKEFLASVYNEDHDIRYDRITLFYLLATTGMRKGEALALTWNDVDLQQHLVSINKTVSRSLHNKQIIATPKTINAYRTLALDKATSKSINEYKKSLPKIPKATDFIFQNAAGNMMSLMTPNHWLAHFIKETGLPKISVHGLRHTFASVQVTNKINPKAVQMQLGHADAEITLDVYTHMERDQVSADVLDIGSLI
ncbi:phage integrase: site-specific recombinase [Lentilactobacillus kosonis]|uniref:Phage integrase: site-specific recombinase n=1 Tax=Lentilactobacillus kosonis TaxID=2810561 RepID=A0A401FPV3_9LACO|nr:site-specific integrase [Lentilactobacillus kosonis]GAY74308.1 phage integrase: site-specific recombinase [Lentilactobacillus kosonis]